MIIREVATRLGQMRLRPTTTGTPTFAPCAWRGWLEVEELEKSVELTPSFDGPQLETNISGWAKVGGGRRFSAVAAPQVQVDRIQVWLNASEEGYSTESDRPPNVWEANLSFGRDNTTDLPYWWEFRVQMPFEDLDKISALLSSGQLVGMRLHFAVDGLLATSISGRPEPEVAFFPDSTMKLAAQVRLLSFDESLITVGPKESLASDLSNCLKPLELRMRSIGIALFWAVIALATVIWFRR
jgi:hypothetical protein